MMKGSSREVEWTAVNPEGMVFGGQQYRFAKVRGGWLVTVDRGLTFIPDPQHENPPEPVD